MAAVGLRATAGIAATGAAGILAWSLVIAAAALYPHREAAAEGMQGMHHVSDPLLIKVAVDELEWRDAKDEHIRVVDADAWMGYDLHKLWLKLDAEHVAGDGTEKGEMQFLYSRAVTPFWDFQIGVRTDFGNPPNRSWAVFGFDGLAPYFIETEAILFIGEAGQTGFRLEAETDLPLTQKLILAPEIELDFHARNDAATGTGAGLSKVEAGLRLRYEFVREFAPYFGVNWHALYNKTADYARAHGDDTVDTHVVLGVKFWF